MLDELFSMHREIMRNIPTSLKRYNYSTINWGAKAICIMGDRGVGKTTLICQNCLEKYETPDRALYVSADHISVLSQGLFNIARDYFAEGGEALYIDEIHKYPNWSIEIKNVLDVYKTKQVVFSASSSLDLQKSKGDLSRRVVYHRLAGLSFREYLLASEELHFPAFSLEEVLKKHVKIADLFVSIPIRKHFRNYLREGCYPFFLEGRDDYLPKLNNVIEKVIFEDIAVVYNLKQTTLPVLKRILWLVATSKGLVPNIDSISKNLQVSRETIYTCLEYLSQSGLLQHLFPAGRGMKLVRKPGKLYLSNTNLHYAILGPLKLGEDLGTIRETFFANQLSVLHKVDLGEQGDFVINEKYTFEVGGRGKTARQVQGVEEAYLALDDIEVGHGRRIPLYLFGFLY